MTPELLAGAALAAVVLVALHRLFFAFPAQSPRDYAGTLPGFDPRHHLAGEMLSEGVIYGPTGRVSARFTARMRGDWDNSGGRLAEDFHFASGEHQHRLWTITDAGGTRFTATAPDIEGQAVGELSGATLRMRYRLRLAKEAGGHLLSVTDWLYLAPNGVILNRSEMRKFGFKVAELVATIRRVA